MVVRDIMTEKPVTIRQDNTLRDALELMRSIGCHHLPVVSRDKHLVGILSSRDCRKALDSPYIDPQHWEDADHLDQIRVGDMMTPAPIIVEPNMPVEEAARLMLVNDINSLPVMRSETLVGIVTTSDILMAFINHHRSNNMLGLSAHHA